MPERSHQEKRRFRRRNVRLLVDYHAAGSVHCEYATTLGAGGLFIDTDAPLTPGTPLKLRFRLPQSEQPHELEGRVAWVHEPAPDQSTAKAPGMGIEFILSPAVERLSRELEEMA
jgi:uncharacterized protein (TIGR02266 family)